MTKQEQDLLNPIKQIGELEYQYRRVKAPIAVPPAVYGLLNQLREELAKWINECIAEMESEE
jgi:hypothetical protein